MYPGAAVVTATGTRDPSSPSLFHVPNGFAYYVARNIH